MCQKVYIKINAVQSSFLCSTGVASIQKLCGVLVRVFRARQVPVKKYLCIPLSALTFCSFIGGYIIYGSLQLSKEKQGAGEQPTAQTYDLRATKTTSNQRATNASEKENKRWSRSGSATAAASSTWYTPACYLPSESESKLESAATASGTCTICALPIVDACK